MTCTWPPTATKSPQLSRLYVEGDIFSVEANIYSDREVEVPLVNLYLAMESMDSHGKVSKQNVHLQAARFWGQGCLLPLRGEVAAVASTMEPATQSGVHTPRYTPHCKAGCC